MPIACPSCKPFRFSDFSNYNGATLRERNSDCILLTLKDLNQRDSIKASQVAFLVEGQKPQSLYFSQEIPSSENTYWFPT